MIAALERAATPPLRAWIEKNRARVVAVSQRVDKQRGGGSPMANLTKAQKAVIDAMRQGSTLDYEPRSAFSSGGYGLTSPDGAFVASVNARVVTALEDATLIERTTPNSYGRTVFRLVDRDAAPLSDAEQRRLGKANAYALDWMDDGGTLPPEIDRLVNQTARKLTPEEGRRMIAWLDKVAGE